jgi:thymidylate synthase (FAD)
MRKSMSEEITEEVPEKVKITLRDDVTVALIDSMGTEDRVVQVAKVSTLGPESRDAEGNTRLLKYLYRDQHGVPFEHVYFTFYLEIPIFVSRQIVKHRISSINEESGRYREMLPNFYVPNEERKLVQVGKTGDYTFEDGDPMQYEAVKFVNRSMGQAFWDNYTALLGMGIAKEVARMSMPVNMYSSMFLTLNLRSLMNFVTKRKEWKDGQVVSHAQKEIEMVTDQMVEIIKEKFPNVWDAYVESGYRQV